MANRLLGILGWLGTALVFAALAIKFLRPAWEQYSLYLAWAGLAVLLIYFAGQWRQVARAMSGRHAKFGALAVASTLIFMGILAGVNYLSSRQHKRWDLTTNRQFSLSDQTRNVLAKLDAPVKVLVFAQEPDFQRFRDRLGEYQYVSKQVSVDYIDPDKKPVQAKQYQVQAYGTVLFEYKDRTERVTSDSEQDLTNGLIKVITGQQKKVYFTQGHGEKDPTNQDERIGYSAIAAALGRENYGVEKLVLAQAGEVPADASVVVVAGPATDFFQPEIDALNRYLDKTGKLFLLLDPAEKPDSPKFTNLEKLLKDWDIEPGQDIVVDASGMGRLIGTDASVPVAATYPTHAITERFDLLTAFPMARSMSPIPGGVNGRVAQTFVETSPRSWSEADLGSLLVTGQVAFDAAKGDRQGPVAIAAAVSVAAATPPPAAPDAAKPADAPKSETRIAAVGDSDFGANGSLGVRGNSDLFMNAIGWLAQQENLISIRPNEAADQRITLTATQQSNIFWLSLLIVPGLIFGSGVYTWWRRR